MNWKAILQSALLSAMVIIALVVFFSTIVMLGKVYGEIGVIIGMVVFIWIILTGAFYAVFK